MMQQRVERVVGGDVTCKLEANLTSGVATMSLSAAGNAISSDDVAGASLAAPVLTPVPPANVTHRERRTSDSSNSSSSNDVFAPLDVAGGKATDDGKLVYKYAEGKGLLPAFDFGRHAGKFVLDVAKESPTYLTWMLKETFAADVKDIVREALQLAGTTERFATLDGKLVYKYAEGRGFLPAFAFGRHEGQFVLDVANESPSYLNWMLQKDFAGDVLDIVRKALVEVAENPNAAPGMLTHIETTMRAGDRATWDGTLVWEPPLNVGKYAGKTLKYLAAKKRSYLNWMLTDEAGFPEDVTRMVKEILLE